MSWPPRPLLPIYPMDDHKFLAFFSCLAFFFVLHNIYGSWAWSASVPIPSAPPFSPQPQNVNCLMSALICFLCLSVWLPVCVYLCVCVCFLLSLFLSLVLSRMAPLSLRSSYAPYPSHRRATWTKNCSVSFCHIYSPSPRASPFPINDSSIIQSLGILYFLRSQGPSVSMMWTTMAT